MIINIKEAILSKLPAKQSDLSKALNINKRVISKVAIEMANSGLITRKKISQKGITTYLIQKNVKRDMNTPSRISQLNPKYKTLLNEKGTFSPCAGCTDFCEPIICINLINWTIHAVQGLQ